MAEFTPSKKTAQDFNNGIEYVDGQGNETGDTVQAETINNLIESQLWAQQKAENAENVALGALSEVENVLEDKTLLPVVKKNLYALGAYDTVTSNGNGRATIARKTGYIFSSDISSIYVSFKYYAHIVFKRAVYYNNQFSLISNLYPTAKNSNFDGTDRGIYFYDNLRVVIKAVNPNEEKTEQEWNDYLKSNNFCIQYELATAYTEEVIENQPIHTLDQSGEEWIRNEWGKGLNLFDENSPYELGGWDGNTGEPTTPSDPTYRRYPNYISVKSNAVYTQNPIARVYFYDGNYKWLSSTVESTFTVPNNANYLRVAGGGAIFESYMLNEGSHPYPYESYYGGIVRESELDKIVSGLTGVYQHTVTMTHRENEVLTVVRFSFINTVSTAFNFATMKSYIDEKYGPSDSSHDLPAQGYEYQVQSGIPITTSIVIFIRSIGNGLSAFINPETGFVFYAADSFTDSVVKV